MFKWQLVKKASHVALKKRAIIEEIHEKQNRLVSSTEIFENAVMEAKNATCDIQNSITEQKQMLALSEQTQSLCLHASNRKGESRAVWNKLRRGVHLDVSVPILTRVNEWVKFQEKQQKFIHMAHVRWEEVYRFEKWWGEARQVRFLYSICPLICIAVAAVIQSFLDFLYERYRSEKSSRYKIAKFKRPSFIGLNLCPFKDLQALWTSL
ncbi:hypothetical protein Tco_0091820 [Tanacetum coccineum]